MGEVSFPLSKFQESLNWDEWFPIVPPASSSSPSQRRGVGELHLVLSLESEEDGEEFQKFLKGLHIENDWVVLDPQMDSFSVTDSIVPFEEREQAPTHESKLEAPEPLNDLPDRMRHLEVKNEEPEPEPESYHQIQYKPQPAIVDDDIQSIQEFLNREKEEQELQFKRMMEQQHTCQICQTVYNPEEVLILDLDCGHLVCQPCLVEHSMQALEDPQRLEIPCPINGCSANILQWALRRSLEPEVFDQFLMRALTLVIETSDEMFRCPNPECGSIVERVSAPNQDRSMAFQNDNLSPQAQAHLDQYRFRCRACSIEFCSSCFRTPYHVGFTCSEFVEYLNGRRCRYCESAIKDQERALSVHAPKFADVCDDEECQEKMKDACTAVHSCGHPCGGIEGESEHLPCLHEDCAKGQDESDFCNVCFVEGLGSAPCIQLKCSHVLHYRCALAKLQKRWPSARVTFGFRDCPICKSPMSHPALEDELRPIAKMEEEIATNAVQRLSFEGLENHEDIKKPGARFYNNPQAFAMNRFAYYPCFKCKKLYFGGQQRCDAGDGNSEFKPEELVCGGCSGADQGGCSIHGKEFIEHKCQFCCRVASWYCWGKTHFCDDCHTRQQKGDYVSKYEHSRLPQCPGKASCPLGVEHPPNGTAFCMGCAFCRQAL